MATKLGVDRSHWPQLVSLCAAALMLPPHPALAEVVQYTDRSAWEAVSGEVITIGAPSVPELARIGGYFAAQGVADMSLGGHSLNSDDAAYWNLPVGTVVFSAGNNLTVPNTIRFAAPVRSVALDWRFYGAWDFILFSGGEQQIVGQGLFLPMPGNLPEFFGLTSSVSFDRMVIMSASGLSPSFGRSMSFSTSLPAPASGVVLLFAAASGSRRRRGR